MTESEWEAQARALAAIHNARLDHNLVEELAEYGLASPTPAQLREALVEIYQLLLNAPTKIHLRYKRIQEAELRNLAAVSEALLDAGSLAWPEGDVVRAAASQARGLDHFLFVHSDIRGKPSNPSTDYLCRSTNTHVIPRPLADQPTSEAVGTPTFSRRGLVWHRIIPAEIDSYTIKLHWFRDLSLSFRRPNAAVVGALFDQLTLTRAKGYEHFVADAAPCKDEADTLDAHVAAAYSGDVKMALWPELTMPPKRRDRLSSRLKRSSLTTAPGRGPGIIAAGSWHEKSDGKVTNRMHVLSPLGEPRFHHDKTLPMESSTLGVEEITPSFEIAVLINDDALIAFAICRDFCEAQIADVYIKLDVDLVVVPSYGDAKTIVAHRQQAHRLSVNPGTQTFVVQQAVPADVDSTATGYVISPTADTATISVKEMAAEPPSATRRISFKKV